MSEEAEDRLGMSPEQWAWFQQYTRGYGDQDENGIDLSLIRGQLNLTPTERLEHLQACQDWLCELRRAAVKHNPRLAQARPVLPPLDCRRIIKTLYDGQLDYVLIGGVALWLHGAALLTQQFEVFIENDDALQRLIRAVLPLGVRARDLIGQLQTTPGDPKREAGFQLATEAGVVDVKLGSFDAEFAECHARSHRVELWDFPARVATLNDQENLLNQVRNDQHPIEWYHIQAVRRLTGGDLVPGPNLAKLH